MGRLQRKKTSGTKKKKKKKAGSAGSAKSSAVITAPGNTTASAAGRDKAMPAVKTATAKKKSQVPSVAAVKPKSNIFHVSIQFLREVKIELKKVTWPSRKQTIGSTAVVVALVLLISLFLGFVDIGLSNLIRAVLQ
jgi:preprotein translocase subunit SecE